LNGGDRNNENEKKRLNRDRPKKNTEQKRNQKNAPKDRKEKQRQQLYSTNTINRPSGMKKTQTQIPNKEQSQDNKVEQQSRQADNATAKKKQG
jgi:hypothetical protein